MRGPGRRGRLPALAGLAHVVLLFLGSAAVAGTRGPGRHSLHASLDEVAVYVEEASLARVWAGEYLAALAYLLFVPFAAYLAVALRGAAPWLAGTMRGFGWLYVGLSLAAIAALAPPLHRELDPAHAAAFLDGRTALLGLAFTSLAAWLLAAGAASTRTPVLPRWAAWSAIALGALQLVAMPLTPYGEELTALPTFGAILWIGVVSVLLARRPAPAPAVAA